MADTTPATPVVAPDLSPATVGKAAAAVAKLEAAVAPFINRKVRAVLYTAGGVAGAAGIAAATIGGIVGGAVGHDLETVGSIAAVVTAVLGLSHLSSK